jgi:hypothetical protein
MSRRYLTIREYCEEHGVTRTTVQHWIRTGKLQAVTFKRPYLIPDGQPVPYKDPLVHKWRYQWKD